VRVDFRCTRTPTYYASGAWRGRWDAEGGGVLINQAIHTIDLAQWIGGAPATVERATVENRRLREVIEVEDYGAAEVRLARGGAMTISCENDGAADWRTEIAIECADASFALGEGYGLIALNHPSVALAGELHALNRIRNEVVKLPGKDVYGDHHALQVLDAVSAARTGRAPMVTIADAAATIQLVLGIYHAAATGAPTPLPVAGAYQRPALLPATTRKSA
jgi:UDP-N-acetyl-2-amino-2-deoxyglucuronate dehydrogenase